MALGTITVIEAAKAPGPLRADIVSIVGDSSYPTGGSAFDAAIATALGLKNYNVLAVLPVDCKGYVPGYDESSGKLKFYQGDNTNAAAAPGVEVANTTNLSGVTFKVCVLSH